MSLRGKLLLALLPLGIALAIVGAIAVGTVSSLGQQSDLILRENYRSVLAAQRMTNAIERIEDAATLALLQRDWGHLRAVPAYRQRFEAELQAAEGNVTEAGEHDAVQHLRQMWGAFQAEFERLPQVDWQTASADIFPQLEVRFAAVRTGVDEVLVLNQDAMVRKAQDARRHAQRMVTSVILAAIAAILVGGLLSATMTTRLLQPLGLLTRTVRRIGDGDFEARVHITGHDELTQLADNVNAMAGRLNQYRRSSLGDLLAAQQASQAAIDSLPDPVVVFDINGAVLSVNNAAEAVLGIALGAGGGEVLAGVPAPARELLERTSRHVLGGKGAYVPKGFEEAAQVPLPDGERWLLPRATPLYGEGHSVAGVTVVLQDVTRLRHIDELRNDLVATVAHEFRTPLTSLRLAIHLCVEQTAGPLTDKQADLLYAARDDCQRLQTLVDELLDLARIQAGRIDLHRQPVPPAALLDAVAATYRSAAEAKNLALEISVLPDLHPVSADRERLQVVLSNLVGNAIRHSPPGQTVQLRAKALNGAVRFEVSDRGEGVPPDYQRTVFDKFVQIPGRESGGAGLGLSFSKEIVQAHGGQIGVESAVGRGSTFWFTVPTST